MVGGRNQKDDSLVINSTNVFAALGALRKKKSDKHQGSSKVGKSTSKDKQEKDKAEPQVFWAPAPLTAKSWADVDDEDDDDYYATNAPIQAVWGAAGDQTNKAKESSSPVEESESEEEEGVDEADDDNEEEHDHEPEIPAKKELIVEKLAEAPKDGDKQLSKKELKKKELAELEAVLAELGYPKSDAHGVAQEKKVENLEKVSEKKEGNAPGESKSAKKKKKKDKAAKEPKEQQSQPNGEEGGNTKGEAAGTEKVEEPSGVDVKEKIKKVVLIKKKKSSKEMDAAARAAASEAAARTARLAAAKKKEKSHYNQQPVR